MAKKVAEVAIAKSKLQESMDRLNKQYGVGTVMTLDENSPRRKYEIISSGSIGVNYITLGIGGFAKGKLYELMGWEGAGKSTICGHAIAECQKLGKVAACIDGEGALDPTYFESLGVDLTKLVLCQPNSGDEGFNVAIDLIKTGEIDLLIIDSDSSLIPKSIMDAPVGESTIGKKARLNSDSYPKLKNALVKYNVCVIVTSQYREKIGLMFGNPTTTQGGHALKFYTDCRIEISKSMAKDGDVAYGNITKMKATKNKMSPPYRVAQFDVVWGEGIDTIKELVELATEYEIINRSGSWYSYGESKLGQGMNSVVTLFKDNPEACEEIRQKLIDKLMHTEELPTDETSEEEQIMAMAAV